MFNNTITSYIKHLTALKAILEKAKAYQVEHKVSDETILNARLALDQFSLSGQVRSTCNFARDSGTVICGKEKEIYEDTEKTLSDLQARIDRVVSGLVTITPDMVKTDLETRLVPLYWMPGKGLTAQYFLETYALSNFYFHYVTAYSILRHYGLAIGKTDYMGGDIDLRDLM